MFGGIVIIIIIHAWTRVTLSQKICYRGTVQCLGRGLSEGMSGGLYWAMWWGKHLRERPDSDAGLQDSTWSGYDLWHPG